MMMTMDTAVHFELITCYHTKCVLTDGRKQSTTNVNLILQCLVVPTYFRKLDLSFTLLKNESTYLVEPKGLGTSKESVFFSSNRESNVARWLQRSMFKFYWIGWLIVFIKKGDRVLKWKWRDYLQYCSVEGYPQQTMPFNAQVKGHPGRHTETLLLQQL